MREFIKPRVVISKCIEHGHTRYNGSQIRSDTVKMLIPHVDFVTVCPEVEIGMPIPRESIRLVKRDDGIHLVQSSGGEDFTDKMTTWVNDTLGKFEFDSNIDGFICKSQSPSCGMHGVKIYPSEGKVGAFASNGHGFYGGQVVERFGHLPVESEGRLTNFSIRHHFLTCIYTLADFRKVLETPKLSTLIKFHANNKYLFMSLNQDKMREAGKITANHEKYEFDKVYKEYAKVLYEILAKPQQPSNTINVLLHIMGYFKEYLTKKEKAFFLDEIERYREHKIPLSALIAILQSWNIRYANDYLRKQTFFFPYPEDLMSITDSGKGRDIKS